MNYAALAKRTRQTSFNADNGRANSKKRFGETISNRSPSKFLSMLEESANLVGGSFEWVDSGEFALTQFCHDTKKKVKLDLNERYKIVEEEVQRDFYTCFLEAHIVETIDEQSGEIVREIDCEACHRDFPLFLEAQKEALARLSNNPSSRIQTLIRKNN